MKRIVWGIVLTTLGALGLLGTLTGAARNQGPDRVSVNMRSQR